MAKKYCGDCSSDNIEASVAPSNPNECVPPCPNPCPPRCGCSSCARTTCQPFYQGASLCPEDNKQKIYIRQIAGVLKTRVQTAMPACDQSIWVPFYDVVDVPLHAWLWSYGIGYLEIVGFNPMTQEIQLRNNCPDNCLGQAPAGTPIGACTVFSVNSPICSPTTGGQGTLTPFLNAGFTAPPEVPDPGSCIDITVTNVNGLSVNKNVSINNGVYRISAIKSATVITICNDGAGLTPGTPVSYQDSQGNLIVPIVLIDANPCLNTPVLSGSLLACDAGTTSPVTGSEIGQVWVLNDPVTGEGNYRTLGIPTLDCTELTACLTLDPALPPGTSYLVQVVSTADFVVGQIVLIGGTEFTVDTIDSATQMHLIPIADPVAVQTYPVGATVCSADCCTLLDARVTILEDRVINNDGSTCVGLWLDAKSAQADAAACATCPASIIATQTLAGEEVSVTMQNESCVNDMEVHFTIDYAWRMELNGAALQSCIFTRSALYSAGLAPQGAPGVVYDIADTHTMVAVPGGTPTLNPKDMVATTSGVFTLGPGQTGQVRAYNQVTYNFGDITSIDVTILATRISYISVAVRT